MTDTVQDVDPDKAQEVAAEEAQVEQETGERPSDPPQ